MATIVCPTVAVEMLIDIKGIKKSLTKNGSVVFIAEEGKSVE
jgi:hypothetical protein